MAVERKRGPKQRRPVRPPQVAIERSPMPRTSELHAERARPAVGPSLLRLGTQALAQALTFATPADMVLRSFFREHPKLGRRDRGIVAEAVFTVLRRLNSFTSLAGGRNPRRLFILGARSQGPVELAITETERAWLTQAESTNLTAAPLAIRAELPDWLLSDLARSMSESDIEALGKGMQVPAPLDLRVNTLYATREDVITRLAASGIEAQPTLHSPVGLRVTGKPALEQHELFQSGTVEVQDEGSQLLGYLLAPRRREMVADFCAGAGGKTMHLGAMMRSEGRLYAFDVSPQRLQRLRARVARAGLSNVQVEVVTSEHDPRFKRLAGKIDRVLVDAPCTGFGTLRRNPDLKWRQQPADLEALQQKQHRILEAASRLLKPGGRLVYATCSILPEENDAVADAFLADHPDFTEMDCQALLAQNDIAIDGGQRLRLFPHLHGTDGFFAAAFERQPAAKSLGNAETVP